MNELIEKLLQPVAGDKPCGPDLSYDPQFEELETILKGKPEVEMGSVQKPAEPPDWSELRDKSVVFLGRAKHLRPAVMLCGSLLRTAGLPGFRDGLQLIRGLLEQYWEALHPLLDPGDNNDPTARLNILGALTAPRGPFTGWLTIVDALYAAPLCQPKGAPPITFGQLQAAKLTQPGGEGAQPNVASLASLGSALRAGAEQVAVNYQAIQEALEAVHGIDNFLTSALSAGKTISFEDLLKVLQEMLSGLQPYLSGATADPGVVSNATGATGDTSGAHPIGIALSGSVRSREDVVRALDSICKYYDLAEPGSPVPFLLRRAQKLATMNFLQAMKELNLATIDSLRPSMGSTVDGDAATTQTPPA